MKTFMKIIFVFSLLLLGPTLVFAQTPTITAPVPDSLLAGSSVQFTWSANGASVTEWWLYVGTSPGAKNIYNSGSLGTTTSDTVSGLPTDGATLHVRLWWKIIGVWSAADYTYTAFMTAGGGVPAMSSPAPGSTLSGSTETFTYMANGASVTEWWLYVGTSTGAKDIYNSGSLGTTTSDTVSGLPTDGATLHVRLWWKISGVWSAAEYTYSSASVNVDPASITPATVTVPVLGQQDFNGGGGVPPYAFIVTGDTTGGASVDFSTGLYTAGPLPGATTVHMADSSQPVELTADALVTVQGGGVPTMSSPAPGSTLSGSTETFTYMANGASVTEWWLYVGTSPRAKNIYNSGSLGTTTSDTVSGLPTDGATLHVRLWWKISGVWSAADYTYTAFMTAGGGVPTMSSPAPGSTLSGSTETFTYMANGASVTEWWLYVGTSPGAKNIYNSGSLGTTTSDTVSGLPTDGATLHVRLWWKIGGSWADQDYTYTAATNLPSITSPVPGSQLAGPSVQLTWSANGIPVTEWQPYIGSEPGELDLFTTGSLGTSSGILATGLPTDGTAIYLRLYYKEGGTEDFIDAQYTAAIRPKLTTPEPNWLLNGADVTFEWVSNGAPVTDWQLNVGTSPGGMDLFESGFLGSSLSTTAFGLPINSNIVWVRLLFKSNGNWDFDDYQYITGSIGDYYVALGDSITRGIGDFDMSDYTSQDGQITGGGYPPILHDFLLAEKGYPNKIVNEGVEGETSLGGLMRVPGVLAKYPNAQFHLIQYGTNDAFSAFPVPSGLGLNPGDSGYPGSFKANMQQIIDLVKNQGKTPLLGLMLYTPLSFLQTSFINYNRVITGDNNDPGLIVTNGIAVVPPDFYAHFEMNPQQLNSDGLHPLGEGHRAMGDLWCGALIGLPFPSTCSTP